MRRLLPLLWLAAGLTGCGFHLRGSYDVPDFLHHIGVKTAPNTDLRGELLLALQTVGIDTDSGALTLNIQRAKLVTQTSAQSTVTEVSEVTLVYDVQYRLQYSDGHAATESRELLLRRSYQNDPTAIVGKTTEADTLTAELRTDAVQQIVRELTALQENQLLPDQPETAPTAASGPAPAPSSPSGPAPAAASTATP